MFKMNVTSFKFCVLFFSFFIITTPVQAETETKVETETLEPINLSTGAEFFGLSFDNLALSKIQKKLKSAGLQSYPSYKTGITSYSLGPEGILGLTNAAIYFNESNYVTQASLTGVVESKEKRKALGEVLLKKYGKPAIGNFLDGFGRARWLFDEGTMIEISNSTFDVSILYVDERPKVATLSGKIDVEALSRKKN